MIKAREHLSSRIFLKSNSSSDHYPNRSCSHSSINDTQKLDQICSYLVERVKQDQPMILQGQIVIMTMQNYKELKQTMSKYSEKTDQIIKRYKGQLQNSQEKLKFIVNSCAELKVSAGTSTGDHFLSLLDKAWRQRNIEKGELVQQNKLLLSDKHTLDLIENTSKHIQNELQKFRNEVLIKNKLVKDQQMQIRGLKQTNKELALSNSYYLKRSVENAQIRRQLSYLALRADQSYFILLRGQDYLKLHLETSKQKREDKGQSNGELMRQF